MAKEYKQNLIYKNRHCTEVWRMGLPNSSHKSHSTSWHSRHKVILVYVHVSAYFIGSIV